MDSADLNGSKTDFCERLQRFRNARYAEHEREQVGSLFPFSTEAIRQDDDAILEHACQVLADRVNGDALTAVAALVLINGIVQTPRETLTEYFGEEVADLVDAASTPFDSACGNVVLWERALQQMAEAPADAQRVRLALLLGQIEHSPDATGHIPFWHQEAKTMSSGDPYLQRRVIERLEAAWANAQ
ncbi:hypothetical protein [Billgrantia gudaonensis]|uniref:Uncharacterized protein n=1 Tax=Billgrantia gudaonensis TaxID=376427 RepID=A0A1G8Y6Y0_9GAMM|nr:hypothetical protein [Halomonas gudaonensis]SDJ98397.1 hypothetical protein SAMN04487954_11017 [Halomonas gudaonensis]